MMLCTTCCAPRTPSGCSRWRVAPRWPRSRDSSPGSSTTWWSRSRSSDPGPSRVARCIPTSVVATAPNRSPICIRCWSRRWPRPSGCHCSRSSSCRWLLMSPGSRRGRLINSVKPWVPNAAPSAWKSSGSGCTRAWRSGESSARSLMPSSTNSRRSPTSVSRRAIRCRSRISCTRARTSSGTSRQRSVPACSTPSQWGSTRRIRWWPMLDAMASRCAPPTSMHRWRVLRSSHHISCRSMRSPPTASMSNSLICVSGCHQYDPSAPNWRRAS